MSDLVLVKEGDREWWIEMEVLMNNAVRHDILSNPHTGDRLPEIVLEEMREYRVSNLKCAVVVNQRQGSEILRAHSVFTILVDSFYTVGDLLGRVLRDSHTDRQDARVVLEGKYLDEVDSDVKVSEVTREKLITLTIVDREERREEVWYPLDTHGEDFVWDVARVDEISVVPTKYKGETLPSSLINLLWNGHSQEITLSPLLGPKVKRMVQSGNSIPSPQLLYPWVGGSDLYWYPLDTYYDGLRSGYLWTLVERGAMIEEKVLERGDKFSAVDASEVREYRNALESGDVVPVLRRSAFSLGVVQRSRELLHVPEISKIVTLSRQSLYWYPTTSKYKGEYVWDVDYAHDIVEVPEEYRGEPLPEPLSREVQRNSHNNLLFSPYLGTKAKALVRDNEELPAIHEIFPWQSELSSRRLLWYPIRERGYGVEWTLVQPGANLSEEEDDFHLSLAPELVEFVSAYNERLKDKGEVPLVPKYGLTPMVLGYVSRQQPLPNPSYESNYWWHHYLSKERERMRKEFPLKTPVDRLRWVPVGLTNAHEKRKRGEVITSSAQRWKWDIVDVDGGDARYPEEYDGFALTPPPMNALLYNYKRGLSIPKEVAYYVGPNALQRIRAKLPLPSRDRVLE